MKLMIVIAAFAVAQADKLNRNYLPPNNAHASAGHSNFLSTPHHSSSSGHSNSGFGARSQTKDSTATIIRQDYTNNGGVYSYAYETSNGIHGEEKGVATNGVQAQGGFSYTGDDGKVYAIWYTADENGFVPQGDHLPTPPPIPEAILKALEQNARDEAAGIFDDGSYKDTQYNSGHQQNSHSGYPRRTPSAQRSYLPPVVVE